MAHRFLEDPHRPPLAGCDPSQARADKLNDWRRVATRYDKTAESYLGFVALASVTLWLPFVHVG